jgi:hypothetical protein
MRILFLLFTTILASPLWAETVFIDATRDNTLYESDEGSLSNGAGQHFFVGLTAGAQKRRGLIAFDDLSAIPDGAKIKSVKLHLRMSRTETAPANISLWRVLSDWGEGDSDAAGNEGMGAPAQTGDATWVHRFFDTQIWKGTGGDFPQLASASLSVGNPGFYTFGSSSGMVIDVTDWKENPDINFGWILTGNEDAPSAKRFESREHSDSAYWPVLEVEYSATGSPFDYSGLWFDPSLDGEGYIIYKTPYGWLVYFFGYSSDGQFMWLVSELVTLDQLLFGVPFELPLLIGEPGTFAMPTPSSELTPWGKLIITFNSCTTGEFKLEGADGDKTSNVVKLVGVEDTICLEL